MTDDTSKTGSAFSASMGGTRGNGAGIRFLVESALKSVVSAKQDSAPRGHDEWVEHLVGALVSESETSHQAAVTSLISSGISSEEVFETYVPDAARRLGELWVEDRASFVDVTVGAARLQSLYRSQAQSDEANWIDRSIPLGQSILMIIPETEMHSLGAFVAANQFRKHGIWVHMAIGLTKEEVANIVRKGRFSMLGISAATLKSLEPVTELVTHLRGTLKKCPPITVGGRVVSEFDDVAQRTGADVAAKTVREAIEHCRLASIVEKLSLDVTV